MSKLEIPEGWESKKLHEICTKITDGTHHSPKNTGKGDFYYITAKNVRPGKINLNNATFVTKQDHDEIFSRCNPEYGDVLLTKDGTIGYSAVNEFDFPFSMLSSVALLKPDSKKINPYYLSYFLNSPELFKQISDEVSGSAIKRIVLRDIKNLRITFPTNISIQQKIVKKLDHILSQFEEKKEVILSTIENFDTNKINENYKNNLLNLAFIGKLTENWRKNHSNTESAEVLFQNIIHTRKESYDKELTNARRKGLRKPKAKFLLEIPENTLELKNNIPKKWTVSNIDFLAFVTKLAGFEYTDYIKPEKSGDVALIKAQNVQMAKFLPKKFEYISKETSDMLPRSQINGNEILMVFIGDLGNVCLAPTDQRYHLAPNVAKIEVDGINREYLYYYLQSPIAKKDALSRMKKSAQPSLSMKTIRMVSVNVPPLEEQKEIVKIIKKKLEEWESHKQELENIQLQHKLIKKHLSNLSSSILYSAFSGKLLN